jgi:hypothetical protein
LWRISSTRMAENVPCSGVAELVSCKAVGITYE